MTYPYYGSRTNNPNSGNSVQHMKTPNSVQSTNNQNNGTGTNDNTSPELVQMELTCKMRIIIFFNNMAKTLIPNLGLLLTTQYLSATYMPPKIIAVTDPAIKTLNKTKASR